MKYYLDTEFLEGTQTKRFLGVPVGKGWKIFDSPYRQTKPTIDLISIGIVSEDGKEFYAVSKDFNLLEAWNRYEIKSVGSGTFITKRKDYWIRDNVLRPIFNDLTMWDRDEDKNSYFTFKNFKYLLNKYGKSREEIAEGIENFIRSCEYPAAQTPIQKSFSKIGKIEPEFYGYYADYDWVVFCWLFGRMIDLPKGFPMYCIDLKQILESKQKWKYRGVEYNSNDLKRVPDYPRQTNEHNALSDARWNKELHEFLKTI